MHILPRKEKECSQCLRRHQVGAPISVYWYQSSAQAEYVLARSENLQIILNSAADSADSENAELESQVAHTFGQLTHVMVAEVQENKICSHRTDKSVKTDLMK